MRPGAAAVLLLAAGCAAGARGSDREAILAVLDAQAAAWNRGDLDAFLLGYHRSPTTVFAGGDRVHRGFDAMAERYRVSFPTREKMGRLSFSGLSFESLEGDAAVMTGAWELEAAGEERGRGGVFTLLWRRLEDGWKIVHDHTSSRP